MDTRNLAGARWRKSSHSGGNGSCVEVARLDGDTVAIRNSNHPAAGTLFFTPAAIAAFVDATKHGDLDDFT